MRNLSEEIASVGGGFKQGGSFEENTALRSDFDMGNVAGITGGAIHVLIDDLQGLPFSAYSGSAFLNNRIFAGDGPALRLNEFSW